jgi:hypothetical protein
MKGLRGCVVMNRLSWMIESESFRLRLMIDWVECWVCD